MQGRLALRGLSQPLPALFDRLYASSCVQAISGGEMGATQESLVRRAGIEPAQSLRTEGF